MVTNNAINTNIPIEETKGGTAQSSYNTGDTLYASASNTLSKLSIDTTPGISYRSNGSIPVWASPFKYLTLTDDFLSGAVLGDLGWQNAVANSANVIINNTASLDADHPGILTATTGTNSAGASTIYLSRNSAQGPILLGGGQLDLYFTMKLPTLSDGTDTYTVILGLISSSTTATPVSGCYFSYTHSVNSGNWTINNVANTSTTTANTTTAADTDWHTYRVTVNADATSVAYYIDGVQVDNSPITTNIPTTNNNNFKVTPGWTIVKSAGTNARLAEMDLFYMNQTLTNSR